MTHKKPVQAGSQPRVVLSDWLPREIREMRSPKANLLFVSGEWVREMAAEFPRPSSRSKPPVEL